MSKFVALVNAKIKQRVVEEGIEYRLNAHLFIERTFPKGRKLVAFYVRIIDRGVADQLQLTVIENTDSRDVVLTADPGVRSVMAGLVAAEKAIVKRVQELEHDQANQDQ